MEWFRITQPPPVQEGDINGKEEQEREGNKKYKRERGTSVTTSLCCVTSQKSEDLIYTAEEARSHTFTHTRAPRDTITCYK